MTLHLDRELVEPLLTWPGVIHAIDVGHAATAPRVDDTLLRRGGDSLLSRAAWVDGLGSLVKTATVFPGNAADGLATVNGSVALFSDRTGELDCTLDFHLITKWKTAADSALAAGRLARADSERILIVGSGTVASSMIDAYRSLFPSARFDVWSRTASNADALAEAAGADRADDLETAVRRADVVCTATMSNDPVIHGSWLHPGQHVDLIGGYRPDMREADDECIGRSSVFVDSLMTARDVGDIARPLEAGVITESDVCDYSALHSGGFARTSDDEITLFKNAGGAHLDLMVARHMYQIATA
ncbi:ornithine cyclodeaminase family protein [Ilumatobacter sp.]|uniref:ornithine cyclodeaminase family protein n=1 Tax=Ilumatobacter sp. TaxID=1967498 RepID=UPI003C4621C4